MRLILEKSDVVKILSKHFGTTLSEENVVVRPDPLEIEVSSISELDFDDAPAPVIASAHQPREARRAAVIETVGDSVDKEPSLEEIHTASQALIRELAQEKTAAKRSGEYSLAPPSGWKDEL